MALSVPRSCDLVRFERVTPSYRRHRARRKNNAQSREYSRAQMQHLRGRPRADAGRCVDEERAGVGCGKFFNGRTRKLRPFTDSGTGHLPPAIMSA